MDTSFWIQCNPKITVEHTTKKYFGKYLYKIVVYSPAGRLLDSKGSMDAALEHRKNVYKHINHSGWWGYRQNRDIDNADLTFLDKLRDLKHNKSLGLKFRIEEPRVQIYATTEQELKDLVSTELKPFLKYLENVAGPVNDEHAEILNSGAIIRKKNNGYRYKVIIRDGRYSSDVKENLLSYLDSLIPEHAQLSKSSREMLTKSTPFVWNLYFYTDDSSVVTFINLIHPGMVSNCHELVVDVNK